MTRMLLAVLASSLVALSAPAIASAHHHHHRGLHKRHAHKARVLRFGEAQAIAAPTPTTPVTQATPGNESAGTVALFENGVLTIMLNDKSTVSGKVTEDTELRCQSATGAGDQQNGDDDQGGGDDHGSAGGDEHGGPSAAGQFAHEHGDVARAADNQGEDEGDDDNNQETCTTAALVKGTEVLSAELKLTGAGAVWEQVDLVH